MNVIYEQYKVQCIGKWGIRQIHICIVCPFLQKLIFFHAYSFALAFQKQLFRLAVTC